VEREAVYGVALVEALDQAELEALLADSPSIFADVQALIEAQLIVWKAEEVRHG
jgi:hypothetical protein